MPNTISNPANFSPQQQTFAFWEEPARTSTVTSNPRARRGGGVAGGVAEHALPKRAAEKRICEKPVCEECTVPEPATVKPTPPTRESLLQQLRQQTASISEPLATTDPADTFSTGSRLLDTWLPGGGLRRGSICEWVAETEAGGAGTLSWIAAARILTGGPSHPIAHGGPVIVVDPGGHFYAPAAIACGIPAERIVWCRVTNRRDAVWTLDQALRCGAVAAVWASLPWGLNDRDGRRLQLAAEAGRTPGLFVRTAAAGRQPSFASVRWHVRSVHASPEQIVPLPKPSRTFAPNPLRHFTDIRVANVTMPNAKTAADRQAFVGLTPDANLHDLDPRPFVDRTRVAASANHSSVNAHETAAVHLAAQLARPASARRQSSGADRRAG